MADDDDPRVPVHLRLRTSALVAVDALAENAELSRSAMLRQLLTLGIRAWTKGQRP